MVYLWLVELMVWYGGVVGGCYGVVNMYSNKKEEKINNRYWVLVLLFYLFFVLSYGIKKCIK